MVELDEIADILSLGCAVHSVRTLAGEWRHYAYGDVPAEWKREFAEYLELGGRVMEH